MTKRKSKILLLSLIVGIFGMIPLFAEDNEVSWDWKPSWFDKGDCGPNALYVLMNLCGKNVSIQEVKKRLPFDPVKGCSLEAMQKVSAELGFPIEARFVKPSEISKVPRPFIIHGITSKEQQLGHFIVVVGFDSAKRNYTLIDPVRETYTVNPETSLLHNFSGYVLIPSDSSSHFWNRLIGLSSIFIGVALLFILLRKHFLPITNRTVQILLVFCLCSMIFGYTSRYDSDPPARKAARGEIIPLLINARELPIRIEPVGNPQHIVTEKQLAVALAASLPLWHPPSVPSLVHELKLWGKNCHFLPETVGGKGRTGQMMIETLLNDQLCAENTVILGDSKGGSYLIDSPYGIHPIQSGSYDAVEYRAETHFGKLTMLMALTGVPLSTPVTTASGRTGTLADILQDTTMNFDWSKELEFAGCSFALWLPPEKSWTNQFDETFTFDDLMNRLLTIPLGKGTCGGCHVPYTIVTLLRGDEQYPIIETKTRQRVEAWIKHVIDVLVQNQLPDGSWDRDWGKTGEKGILYNDIVLDKITAIGHHLEWIALLPESFAVPKETIQKAIVAVTEQIEQLPPLAKRSFKTVLPCSHAAKAFVIDPPGKF